MAPAAPRESSGLPACGVGRAYHIPTMCGRFTNLMTWREMVDLYRVTDVGRTPNQPARYNVAPTQTIPVVRSTAGGGRELALLRWGLIPHWAKDMRIGTKMINARAETVTDKPAFRHAFRTRRCLVPADGYYEWQAHGRGPKQPYRITLADGAPFAFAGLWDRWQGPDGPLDSCTIVTTTAPDAISVIHDRMPVILDADGQDAWLDVEQPRDILLDLLVPVAPDRIEARPVSRRVNDVRNDDAACIAPMGGD